MQVTSVRAPNPGPFTGEGTNTYILTDAGDALVIDPGPDDPGHLDRVVAGLDGLRLVGIAVTHGHPDHAPGAAPLARRWDAPVLAETSGLVDGTTTQIGAVEVVALATPGHSVDHFVFRADGALFAGDLMMTGSTVVIDDLAAYLTSLERIAALPLDVIYPGHGAPIDDPGRAVQDLVEHRLQREREILGAVSGGASTIAAIVGTVYAALDPALRPLAAASVAAHLRKLASEGRVAFLGPEDGWDIAVRLVEAGS